MSKIVARTQKVKSGNLIGIGNHNQRKFEKHSNKEIDPEKKKLNYDLVQGRTENFKTDIEKFINENKSTSRAVRKDAVLVNEWLISSDQDFFKNLSEDRTREFFEASKDYFSEKYGDQNIRYAIVHLDETTPHMHMGIVPFDENNKLSAKRMFNKTALKEIQAELPEYLKNKGFDIERGEKDSERKNLSVPEYKEAIKKQEILENKIENLEVKIIALEQVSEDLTSEIEEKATQLEDESFTLKDYGYNEIEEVLYGTYRLQRQFDAIFEKLQEYAEKLMNLKVNVLNISEVKANINGLVNALKDFKERLAFKALPYEKFKENIQKQVRETKSREPRKSINDRLDQKIAEIQRDRQILSKNRKMDDFER